MAGTADRARPAPLNRSAVRCGRKSSDRGGAQWVEEAPAQGIATGTRATVNEHHRQAFRGTAFIDIERVGVIDSQIVPGMRFDLRVQSLHCALRKGSSHPCGDVYLVCRPAS